MRGRRRREADPATPAPANPAAESYARALRMIELRAYAAGELERRLRQKGDAPDIAAATVARLRDSGLVNDAQFARQFTRSRLVSRGVSVRRVEQELGRRGVSRAESAAAIAEVSADEQLDEAALVERAARKKLRTLSTLDAATRARRLIGFLARRGFRLDTILTVLRALDREAATASSHD